MKATATFRSAVRVPLFEILERRMLLSAAELAALTPVVPPQQPTPAAALPADPQASQAAATEEAGAATQGALPAKVSLAYDAGATSGSPPASQAVVDQMMSNAIRWLTGQRSGSAAWDALFRAVNQSNGGTDVGYSSGQTILIQTAPAGQGGAGSAIEVSPQALQALVRQLVYAAGVDDANITISGRTDAADDDAVRQEFPDAVFAGHESDDGIATARAGGQAVGTSRPTEEREAEYSISLSELSEHDREGAPPPPSPAGEQSSGQTGGKVLLYVVDALFAPMSQAGQTGTLDSGFTSTLFASQNQAAIDAVASSLLKAASVPGEPSLLASTDSFLQQAAAAAQRAADAGPNSLAGLTTLGASDLLGSGIELIFSDATAFGLSDDLVGTSLNTPVQIDVLGNDHTASAPLVILEYTQPAHGSVSYKDGLLIYTPAGDFSGLDSFTYTAADSQGNAGAATVRVKVGAAVEQDIHGRVDFIDPDGRQATVRLTGPGRGEIIATGAAQGDAGLLLLTGATEQSILTMVARGLGLPDADAAGLQGSLARILAKAAGITRSLGLVGLGNLGSQLSALWIGLLRASSQIATDAQPQPPAQAESAPVDGVDVLQAAADEKAQTGDDLGLNLDDTATTDGMAWPYGGPWKIAGEVGAVFVGGVADIGVLRATGNVGGSALDAARTVRHVSFDLSAVVGADRLDGVQAGLDPQRVFPADKNFAAGDFGTVRLLNGEAAGGDQTTPAQGDTPNSDALLERL